MVVAEKGYRRYRTLDQRRDQAPEIWGKGGGRSRHNARIRSLFWWCGPEDHLSQEKWEPRKRLSPCGQTWRSENPMHCHPKLYLKKQYTQEENGRAFCNFLFAETDTCFQPGFSSQTVPTETPRRAPKFAELGFPSWHLHIDSLSETLCNWLGSLLIPH